MTRSIIYPPRPPKKMYQTRKGGAPPPTHTRKQPVCAVVRQGRLFGLFGWFVVVFLCYSDVFRRSTVDFMSHHSFVPLKILRLLERV